MKVEKSHKRNMLVRWGLKMLTNGYSPADVQKTIGRMMRRTTAEVSAFIQQERFK